MAAEVRDAIERSGLSRTEFASRIGTSAPRLLTHTTCKAVPSAVLLRRMRKLVPARGRTERG